MQKMERRRFLGLSALSTAAVLGSSTIMLPGCKKEEPVTYGLETEAIVIGSGFGGAVSSLRLTEQGIPTLLLEMGKQWDIAGNKDVFCTTLKPDGRSTWLRTETILPLGPKLSWNTGKYVGVLDRVDYENMRMYRGTCLGGGSVVYGAMLPQAQEDILHRVLPDIPYAELHEKWYPLVRSVIKTSVAPQEVLNSKYYQYARVGFEHCDKAGMERVYLNAGVNFFTIKAEIEGNAKRAITSSDLLYGVNNGAKNSVDRNYIAQALGTGNLKIETLTKVDVIKVLSDGRFEVVAQKINTKGEGVKTVTYTCKYLFVNAGVVGTNEILVKSRNLGYLPDMSAEVGKGVGFNGNAMAMRKVNEEVGADQGTVPISGYLQRDNPYGKVLVEQAPFPMGIELKRLLALAVTQNESRGYFDFDATMTKADFKLSPTATQQSVESMRFFLNRIIDANGGEIDGQTFPGGISNNFTYHPLGGVVLGKASDMYGRVNGYKNLYVLDGSMIPGESGGCNPALTIAAIAERCMENILKYDFA